MKLFNDVSKLFKFDVIICFISLFLLADLGLANSRGRAVYLKQCASCHGESGQGVQGEYNDALYGDWSLGKIRRYVEKNMPEDDPDECIGEDAEKVSQYIYEKFYSEEAKFRNAPKRIGLARLTNRQYRESTSDLFQGLFQIKKGTEEADHSNGLNASYYDSKGMNKKDNLKHNRVDQAIDFDFGSDSPMDGIKNEQFSIDWEGSLLVQETGTYGLRITTPNGARLYLNENLKEGDKNRRDDASKASTPPLIDAWVSSGNKTRTETVQVYLQGGRKYPMRFDFFKYKEKEGFVKFEWKPPGSTWRVPSHNDFSTYMGPKVILAKTSFPADDRSLGYERGIDVSEEWFNSLTRSALDIAQQFGDSFMANNADEEHLRSVANMVLERAFRRSLSDDEKEENINRIFKEVQSPDIALKRIVLLAIKSPQFLYPGLSSGKDSSHQVASRLALGLWDSIPDNELLDAAKVVDFNNKDQLKSQVYRMLNDSRTRSKVLAFFYHWLDLDYGRDIAKDKNIYPNFNIGKISNLRRSMNIFLEDVFWSENSNFKELFLASYLYLNKDLSDLYAEPNQEEDFIRVNFSESKRSGILTHPYILSQFSYPYNSSPIHRGVFLTRHMLGRTLKPPPEAVSFENQTLDPSLSMREKVAHVTRASNCMSCHEIINSLGFSLENYDAIGRWRSSDKDKKIDASSSYETSSGKMINLNGSRSLAEFIANDSKSQKAFIKSMFEYMIKQPIQAYGQKTMEYLFNGFRESGYNCRELLVDIMCISSIQGIEKGDL